MTYQNTTYKPVGESWPPYGLIPCPDSYFSSPTPTVPGQVVTPALDAMIERLAALEHERWIAWSKGVARTECLSAERLWRWHKLWKPYAELTEVEKGKDREWAEKVLDLLMEI